MNKYIIVLLVCFSSLFGMKIEAVSDNKKVKEKQSFFMKDDRKVIKAFQPKVIKAFQPKVIKAFQPKVIKAYEIEGKLVEKKAPIQIKKVELKPKNIDIKKQFIKKEDLIIHSKPKEKIKVSSESVDFFESINKEDSEPVNME